MRKDWKHGFLLALLSVLSVVLFVSFASAVELASGWELVEEQEEMGSFRFNYRDGSGNILIDFHLREEEVDLPFRLTAYFNQVRLNTLSRIDGYQPVSVREFEIDTGPVIRYDYTFSSLGGEVVRGVGVWTERQGALHSLFFYCYEQSYHQLRDAIESTIGLVLAEPKSPEEMLIEVALAETMMPDQAGDEDAVMAFLEDFERSRIEGDFPGLLNLYADPYTYTSDSTGETVTFRIGDWALRLQENLEHFDYNRWQHDYPEVRFTDPDRAVVTTERMVRYTRGGKEYRFWDWAELTLVQEQEGWKLQTLRILEVY